MSSPQTAIPFGKYLLIKRLAVGGMAELFLAQKPPDPELVVLKRILPYLSEEPEFVQMFLDEARIAAQLHHPNIVQVHELGKLGDNIFIAMEYVEGVDLRRVMAEEAKFGASMPYGVAARICAQVAGGLDYAHHSRGVDGRPLELIHRDVSPQNVMIAYDGRVKLVDFGIAKAGAFMDRSKPGVIKGKFLYLAPEQVMQERLDHRTDIFALGSMLYEITTGRQPFAKPTTEGILYAIRYEEPSPPHLLRADYPEELSRIVMRCLVKDRNQRYPRASAVRADLEAFLNSGVLRQSTDVSEYIARLLGEEEERTVLHIPATPAGRRDATVPLPAHRPAPEASTATASNTSPPGEPREPEDEPEVTASVSRSGTTVPLTTPAGLTARPQARRPTGEAVSLPDYGSEPEPATQMARPSELPTSGPDDDPEAEESTAIRTLPGNVPAPPPRPVEDEVDEGDGEFTVPLRRRPRLLDERQPRPASSATVPGRRSSFSDLPPPPVPSRVVPAVEARPPTESGRSRRVPPMPVAAPRRPVEVDDEASASVSVTPPMPRRPTSMQPSASRVDDEASRSISLTQPGPPPPRASRVAPPPPRPAPEDDEHFHTDASLSGATDPTGSLDEDPDDDESTAGYAGDEDGDDVERDTLAMPSGRKKRSVALLVVGGAAVLVALGVGLVWALRPTEPVAAPMPPPAGPLGLAPPAGAPAEPRQPAVAPPPPTEPAPEAVAAVEDAGTAEVTEAGDAGAAGDTGALAATNAPADAGTSAPPAEVAEVKVKFEAPPKTVLGRPGGGRLAINKVLSLPPGPLRVSYDCPGRRSPRGIETYMVRSGEAEPVILKVPCKGRR